MNHSQKKIYEFHFKMDTDMKNKLKSIPLYKKAGSLSPFIVRVLKLLSPRMEKEHLAGKEKMSQYEFVCDDQEIGRESVHVYLPDYLYRELKLMHQDLNVYSIAQLLRMMLRVFIDLAERFGDQVESILIESYRQWKNEREARKYRWKPIRQLLFFIYQKPRKSRFLTLYSNKFAPIDIYRL